MLKLLQNSDFYKTGHKNMYPDGTKFIHSTWVARNGKHSNSINTGTIHFGLKYFIDVLNDAVEEIINMCLYLHNDSIVFVDMASNYYKKFIEESLGQTQFDVTHIEELLHYVIEHESLPIIIKSVEEGKFYNYQDVLITVENTDPRFFWLPNYLETWLSSTLWLASTSATTSYALSKLAVHPYQMHDFSYRGMGSNESAVLSGMGHLLFNSGSDTMPAIIKFKELYPEVTRHMGSVVATEHSVMCSYGKEHEDATYDVLLDKYPNGIVSIVSDTWNYWRVLTETLPKLKDKIMARNGKLVIRPDSGDQVDIVCGIIIAPHRNTRAVTIEERYPHWTPEEMGSLRLLWETFGGTINDKGLMVLNDKIGLIYGDGMNLDNIQQMYSRMEAIGFDRCNIVFGVGSYQYQYVTRDTHSFAFKATAICNKDDQWVDLIKDPITDHDKKSVTGRFDLPYQAYPNWELPKLKVEGE